MLPYMAFWPAPNGPELLVQRPPERHGLLLQQSQAIHPRRFRHRCERTTEFGNRDTLSAAYTIDDGTSLIPLADPLFASFTTLRMQVASIEETHIFSPQMLNTFRAGFSRAGFNLNSSLLARFRPASLLSPARAPAESSSAAA